MQSRKYIFLVHDISGIGGMQLYLSRKIDYLEKNNWNTIVYYYHSGEILIPNLKKYIENCIPRLRICVGNNSKKNQERILGKIKKEIGDTQEIIIESSNYSIGTWGEYIASKTNAKHILYHINETSPTPTPQMKEFLNFKIQQHLLFCIKGKVISQIFPEITNFDNLVLKAVGCSSDNVEEYSIDIVDKLPEKGNNILSLGRLEKPYIPHLFKSISEFAKQNPLKDFNLFIIGDTNNRSLKEDLLKIIKTQRNIKVYDLGSLWPIPKEIFKKARVAVGSAGSISLCSKQGIPSISIDSNDHEAIGILRHNTTNTLFRTIKDPNITIVEYLNKIIIENEVPRLPLIQDSPLDYSSHQEIIDKPHEKKYFPTEKSKKLVSHHIFRSIIIRFDQNSTGNTIINFLHKLRLFKIIIKRLN